MTNRELIDKLKKVYRITLANLELCHDEDSKMGELASFVRQTKHIEGEFNRDMDKYGTHHSYFDNLTKEGGDNNEDTNC